MKAETFTEDSLVFSLICVSFIQNKIKKQSFMILKFVKFWKMTGKR